MNTEIFTSDVVFSIITLTSVLLAMYVNSRNLKIGFKNQIDENATWKADIKNSISNLERASIRTETKVDDQGKKFDELNISVRLLQNEQETVWKRIDEIKKLKYE